MTMPIESVGQSRNVIRD